MSSASRVKRLTSFAAFDVGWPGKLHADKAYDHKAEHFQAFADLGCVLICYRRLTKATI